MTIAREETFKPVFNFATLSNKHLQRFGAKMVKLCNTLAELKEEILDAGDKLVVIGVQSPPCRIMSQEVEKLAVEEKDVVFLKVNIKHNTVTVNTKNYLNYLLTKLPTFILIKDGALKDEVLGTKLDKLKDTINKHK